VKSTYKNKRAQYKAERDALQQEVDRLKREAAKTPPPKPIPK
jgi:response regulator of citrate/malate metabolism